MPAAVSWERPSCCTVGRVVGHHVATSKEQLTPDADAKLLELWVTQIAHRRAFSCASDDRLERLEGGVAGEQLVEFLLKAALLFREPSSCEGRAATTVILASTLIVAHRHHVGAADRAPGARVRFALGSWALRARPSGPSEHFDDLKGKRRRFLEAGVSVCP